MQPQISWLIARLWNFLTREYTFIKHSVNHHRHQQQHHCVCFHYRHFMFQHSMQLENDTSAFLCKINVLCVEREYAENERTCGNVIINFVKCLKAIIFSEIAAAAAAAAVWQTDIYCWYSCCVICTHLWPFHSIQLDVSFCVFFASWKMMCSVLS